MVDDDSFPWHSPPCPRCGDELDIEPAGTGAGIRIGYRCRDHGIVMIGDPFDDTPYLSAPAAAPSSAGHPDPAVPDTA